MPVEVSWCRMADWIGEQPRRSGRREGWMFRPRYFAPLRTRGGTKRPNDTAIIRFISGFMGGDQPVNVSRSWMCDSGISSSSATVFKTGMVLFFRPRPVALPGRWKTEIDSIKEGFDACSACRARRTVAESSSEPQKRMRSGSGEASVVDVRRGRDSMSRLVRDPTSRWTW